MVGTKVLNCKDQLFGNVLCLNQPVFTLTIMFIMDLILFFLDTFLWYIIWNAVFRITCSFTLSLSIRTPWKEVFVRLPKRIYTKLLVTVDMEVNYKPKVLVSQIWNAIIILMYGEHLLSIDHMQNLLYHQVTTDGEGTHRALCALAFFISQGDHRFKGEFFLSGSKTECRISFPQSLTTSIPEVLPDFG